MFCKKIKSGFRMSIFRPQQLDSISTGPVGSTPDTKNCNYG